MSAITTTKPLEVLDGSAALDAERARVFLGNISRAKLDRFSDAGIIRSVKLGGQRRWLVSDLSAYLRSLR